MARLTVGPEPVPLAADAGGAVRVGGTRVTLDVVAADFDEGASPEEVAQRHPTLDLSDVYSVFTYYLRHRAEVQAYLLDRRRRSEEVRLENERRFPPEGVRERLLARRRNPGSTEVRGDPPLAADEDLDNNIVRGVLRRNPRVDVVRA